MAAKLDAELLERLYARLQRCREMCGGRRGGGHVCPPLSSSTVRKVHFILSASLERAVRWRHLGVKKAAMAVAPAPRQTDPDPPTAAEAAAIVPAGAIDAMIDAATSEETLVHSADWAATPDR